MLARIKKDILSTDYGILLIAILLSIAGVVAIFSAGYDPATGEVEDFYKRQMIWNGIGLAAFFIISFIGYKRFIRFAPFIYGIGIAVLILVLVNGHIGMGAQRWIGFGSIKIRI